MQAQTLSTTNAVEGSVSPSSFTSILTSLQSLTSSVSLQCVETLLRAGLGCIAYLRQAKLLGLLPFENFSEYHLSAEINNTLSTQPSGSFCTDSQTRRTVSGVTIMNLKRGFTNEGDKILDYLEHGIFDAIEKQYLRKFIFGIYLVSFPPLVIVEAYTFNFRYHKVPGTNTVVPILSLGDQLSQLSLGYERSEEPMTKSLKQGKQPTLGEVKRSLKVCEALIWSPESRFGNFKLFFSEDTPDDYQPPHFRAGDVDSNKWYFTTHGTSETPEKMSIGDFETGWHGVNMNVASVSSYLPSITEDNDALFTGITNSAPKLSPVEEARLRAEDAELQRKDALDRNVVWDADGGEDAIGEETSDEGIVLARYDGVSAFVPIGLRGDDGAIQAIPEASGSGCVLGKSQYTPTRVGRLVRTDTHHMEDTQVISGTGEAELPSHSHSRSPSVQRQPSLPPSDVTMSNASVSQVDTQLLEAKLRDNMFCSITSDENILQNSIEPSETHVNQIDDVCIFCEGGCKRWFHVLGFQFSRLIGGNQWSRSYHSSQDKRLPEQFLCLDCRLQKSSEWDIITGKIHSDIICRFKDLALFRGALLASNLYAASDMYLTADLGCTAALASQLLARLEDEAFIATESAINDGTGSVRDIAKKTKKQTRSEAKKTQKELQKTKFVFLHASKRGKAYHDYFNPDPVVENRLMGLTDKVDPKIIHIHKHHSRIRFSDSYRFFDEGQVVSFSSIQGGDG
ncbi:HORMA domain-containing protein [Pisolithus croceorrhizus]|nr:HORMA domain-containing protein [Pisolithus croceorrhizus]